MTGSETAPEPAGAVDKTGDTALTAVLSLLMSLLLPRAPHAASETAASASDAQVTTRLRMLTYRKLNERRLIAEIVP